MNLSEYILDNYKAEKFISPGTESLQGTFKPVLPTLPIYPTLLNEATIAKAWSIT